jgi:peptide/nickel transport system ATP-binding protein
MSLLAVEGLNVRFATPDGEVHAVRDLSYTLEHGETLAIVGESGSGKSQSVLALTGLLAANGRASGSARFAGEELIGLGERALRRLRGPRIAMVFQDPMTSLNPYLTVGDQLMQALRAHRQLSRRDARARCTEMLDAVGIADAARRLKRYPHELSGGMRQRVMIAASLLLDPELLIADEPTTALDVTVQAQILELIRQLKARFGASLILITHDLGVVAGLADRVLVMRDGTLREHGEVREVFYRPRDEYTRTLLAAVPRLDRPRREASEAAALRHDTAAPLLSVAGLSVRFRVRTGGWWGATRELSAVDAVDLELMPGETLGIVGESGCGKSTLARAILRLVPEASGRVAFLGRDLTALDRAALRPLRADLQVVFQDPLAALNPRMSVGDIVAEPLRTHRPDWPRARVRAEVESILRQVGLSGRELNRYPHEFSGGQCQRIAIARALVLKPRLVICDEPVSALDVSIRAQIVDLLIALKRELGLALIFIAHDLAVVRDISDRVVVMYLGRAVEIAPREGLYEQPRHPYTRALIGAVPIPDPDLERARARPIIAGEPPSPLAPPSGCRFRTRCAHAIERCTREVPVLRDFQGGSVACHRAEALWSGQAGPIHE